MTTVLSDNGSAFCGRPDSHLHGIFLQLEDIRHTATRVGRPQSNGFVERFHRTVLDEHFRVVGRKKRYDRLEEMQADLDAYLETCNTKRPHPGCNMNGRTPHEAFLDALTRKREDKEVKNAAWISDPEEAGVR